jgi:hypothetical protein
MKNISGKNIEKHFVNNELFINQCRNDWKGVQTYPQKLIKKRYIDCVDAFRGATCGTITCLKVQ